MKNVLFAAMFIMFVVIGIGFFISSMGSLDAGTDVQGSAYQDAFTDTADSSITMLNLLSYVVSVVGVAVLLVAVFLINRRRLY